MKGVLWLASESGIHRFYPASRKFTSYQHDENHSDSLSDDHVNFLFIDASDNVWAGTQNGLDLFNRTTHTFRTFSDKDGMAGNVASCILEDERHHLWIGMNQGLSEFDRASSSFENYSVADGLPGPDLTGWASCYRAQDGTLYFGGFSGAISFRPQDLKPNWNAVPVMFTKLIVDGSEASASDPALGDSDITFAKELTLPHTRNNFSVEFAALSFRDPAAIRYRFRLVGLSDQWRTVDSRQRVRVHWLSSLVEQSWTNSLTLPTLFCKETGAESIQGPVVVVSDIADGLTTLFRHFPKTISLKDMKFQRFALIGRKLIAQPVQDRLPVDCVGRRLDRAALDAVFVELLSVVVLTKFKMPPAVDGAMVGDLNDPRNSRSLRGVEELRLLEEIEKDILAKVVGLRSVSQDSPGCIEDSPAMTTEQECERFLRTQTHSREQGLIGLFRA